MTFLIKDALIQGCYFKITPKLNSNQKGKNKMLQFLTILKSVFTLGKTVKETVKEYKEEKIFEQKKEEILQKNKENMEKSTELWAERLFDIIPKISAALATRATNLKLLKNKVSTEVILDKVADKNNPDIKVDVLFNKDEFIEPRVIHDMGAEVSIKRKNSISTFNIQIPVLVKLSSKKSVAKKTGETYKITANSYIMKDIIKDTVLNISQFEGVNPKQFDASVEATIVYKLLYKENVKTYDAFTLDRNLTKIKIEIFEKEIKEETSGELS